MAAAMSSKVKNQKKETLAKRYGSKCWICGRRGDWFEFTLDHKLPRSLGGTNENSNLRLACATCNSDRGNSSLRLKESY